MRTTELRIAVLVLALAAVAGCSAATNSGSFVPPKGEDVVGDRALILFAEAEPDVGPAPLSVQFSVWDPYFTTEEPKFFWDFGDGSPISNERKPLHVYEKPGNYTVKFYATDTQNLVDDDEVEIQVEEP